MEIKFSSIGVVVMLATFFLGTYLAKQGYERLSEADRQALAARGSDVLGIALIISVFVCALFARASPLLMSIAGAVICVVAIARAVVRFNVRSWPPVARTLLVAGNSALQLGGPILVALTAAGVR
jgi:hypothetical protein